MNEEFERVADQIKEVYEDWDDVWGQFLGVWYHNEKEMRGLAYLGNAVDDAFRAFVSAIEKIQNKRGNR